MITQKEYKKRRDILAKKLSKNSIGIIFSSTYKTRSNDTDYPYRQDSNFYYLTGFKEDNSALVFVKTKNETKTVLFVQKKDAQLELWTGKRMGKKKAKKRFLVDEVFVSDDLQKRLEKYVVGKKTLYCDLSSKDKRVKRFLKQSSAIKTQKNIIHFIQEMRLIKSPSEINLIKKAISITKDAHHSVMKSKKIGKKEYELLAQIEYEFKSKGAYSDAYTSIVAGGNNANTLHYIKNNKPLIDKELILIDAGSEYKHYASDITRTIPVNGKFTSSQKKLYKLVLDTQLEIISMIKPHVKRSDLQKKAEELLTKGMIKLGILKGNYKKLIKKQKHKKYYPHGIGHWMGLDVHDPAPYINYDDKEIPLDKGMVLTIEPGLYIDKNDKSVPKKYRGIGIRIEDNILVTKDGYENLSKDIVKTIKEIESISFKS
ncbi:aminopeptidase P N-terminal domain-containing protein [Sulfurimonas sp.]|uniref:aminopeptidase P N-terminal domain-containing protein n=1 Tax=Sulfurimonas sp. TaxID=2022749 RepID=UPI00262A1467|nr:aminopeptidase P N-terminal domain-containing protein [Sulfurimonas sp.]MCW8895263.1 aminopeptidase P N-terminal domain-containing protein [Sulfurimonas sp.]